MNYEIAYNKATETLNREINLLFQRLNFFLIATAFLLTAFATIVAGGRNSDLLSINYVIAAAGFIYSSLIATTNYLNTRIIYGIGVYIRGLEKKDFAQEVKQSLLPSYAINRIVKGLINKKSGFSLVCPMIKSCSNVVFNLKKINDESVGNHTYIVPCLFSLVWLALIVFLLFR